MSQVDERPRAPVEHFERLYTESQDPWSYETSEYERDKYQRTLDFLPRFTGRTLEVGCSIGVFTEMLADRATELVAVDFSTAALDRARERLAGHRKIKFELRVLPEETPEGPFDTIVCSEVLYYWSPQLVEDGLARLEDALAPSGTLVATHWRGSDPRRELTGDDVHRILREHTRLRWEAGARTSEYLLDRWSG